LMQINIPQVPPTDDKQHLMLPGDAIATERNLWNCLSSHAVPG
jgi:hypothetical protein